MKTHTKRNAAEVMGPHNSFFYEKTRRKKSSPVFFPGDKKPGENNSFFLRENPKEKSSPVFFSGEKTW
jgi:hypothetical protein